jgi:hypothetical protein
VFLKDIFFRRVNKSSLTKQEYLKYDEFLTKSLITDFKFLYQRIPFINKSEFYPFKNESKYYGRLYEFYKEYIEPIQYTFEKEENQYFSEAERTNLLLSKNFFNKPIMAEMEDYYNYSNFVLYDPNNNEKSLIEMRRRLSSFSFERFFLGITEFESIKNSFFS